MEISKNERSKPLNRATSLVKSRYERMATFFDFLEWFGGPRLRRWRTLLWSKVEGNNILEIGVGTGANIPYYPAGVKVTAIDFSTNMLKRAQKKASRLKKDVILEDMDVQSLKYADATFDTVLASFVFCSVPDPIQGLSEIKRVCKLNGKIVLLEHVLSTNRMLRFVMNLFNPLILWTLGDNVNRQTVEYVTKVGLEIEKVIDLSGIFKLIEGRNKEALNL